MIVLMRLSSKGTVANKDCAKYTWVNKPHAFASIEYRQSGKSQYTLFKYLLFLMRVICHHSVKLR